MVYVRLLLFAQVNGFGIASALKIKNTVIIPSMLIITYKRPFGIGRKSGLASTRKPEEDSCIIVITNICRTMHGSDILQGKVIIHDTEYPLLHLSSVPASKYNRHPFSKIKRRDHIRIQTLLLPAGIRGFGGIESDKIRLKIHQFFLCRADKHVFDKMGLPGNFHNKADIQTGIRISTAKAINHVKLFTRKLVYCSFLNAIPDLRTYRFIVVF